MLSSKRIKVSILAMFSLMALTVTVFLVNLPELGGGTAMAETGDCVGTSKEISSAITRTSDNIKWLPSANALNQSPPDGKVAYSSPYGKITYQVDAKNVKAGQKYYLYNPSQYAGIRYAPVGYIQDKNGDNIAYLSTEGSKKLILTWTPIAEKKATVSARFTIIVDIYVQQKPGLAKQFTVNLGLTGCNNPLPKHNLTLRDAGSTAPEVGLQVGFLNEQQLIRSGYLAILGHTGRSNYNYSVEIMSPGLKFDLEYVRKELNNKESDAHWAVGTYFRSHDREGGRIGDPVRYKYPFFTIPGDGENQNMPVKIRESKNGKRLDITYKSTAPHNKALYLWIPLVTDGTKAKVGQTITWKATNQYGNWGTWHAKVDALSSSGGSSTLRPGELEITKTVDGIEENDKVLNGETKTFKYLVKNTGVDVVTGINLVDDVIGKINCPKTMLTEGEEMICTANGQIFPNQNGN